MRRLTILILGVLAFCLCCVPADAGLRGRLRERRVSVEKKVVKKTEIKRKHATDNRAPSGCAGGQCPVK